MSEARCEIDAEVSQQGTLLGMMGWVKHVIRLVGFNAPMPATAVETCVAPSHYAKELKERAQSHQAHILLFYVGYEDCHLIATWRWPLLRVFWAAWAPSWCLMSRGILRFPQRCYRGQIPRATGWITWGRCRCSCYIAAS
jgi:hypothetical protein